MAPRSVSFFLPASIVQAPFFSQSSSDAREARGHGISKGRGTRRANVAESVPTVAVKALGTNAEEISGEKSWLSVDKWKSEMFDSFSILIVMLILTDININISININNSNNDNDNNTNKVDDSCIGFTTYLMNLIWT